jgi:Skp family chaperone for outer membrane proteins
MKKLIIAALILIPFLAPSVRALEIPLTGGTSSGGGGGSKIGYVDMERIFQIYPQTKDAKDDYAKQLAKKRKQLDEKEAELQSIRDRLKVLGSTLKDMNTSTSTGTAEVASSQTLLDMQKGLQQKEQEFEDLKKRAVEDLNTYQSQQSQIILGKIYQALRDLALEEQVALVVDKSSILYGGADVDLTDKLQVKVRGY